MATLYASKGKIANKGDYHGEHVIRSSYSSNTTFSAGDVIIAARLPAFCMVTDVVLIPGAACTAAVFQCGTSASAEQFIFSATVTVAYAATSQPKAVGYEFSCSDEVAVRYENITVTPRSGVTAGRMFDLIVRYMPKDD